MPVPTSVRFGPVRRVALTLASCLLGVVPAWAHTDSPGALPVTPLTLQLQHRTGAEIVALFSRRNLPRPGDTPRAARTDTQDSLIPSGTEALYRTQAAREVTAATREGIDLLARCVAVLDAPLTTLGPERQRLTLSLRNGNPLSLKRSALAQPGAGTISTHGTALTLEGSPAWLHTVQRLVIQAELGTLPVSRQR